MLRLLLLSLFIGVVAALLGYALDSTPQAVALVDTAAPPPSPTRFMRDELPVLVGPAMLDYSVTVTNPFTTPVVFEPLNCFCACTETVRSVDRLGPGESATVQLRIRPSTRIGRHTFYCSWVDDANREWSAGVALDLVAHEIFSENRLDFGKLARGTQMAKTLDYLQHATSADKLLPAPEFKSTAPGVSIRVLESSTQSLPGGMIQRRTKLELSVSGDGVKGPHFGQLVAAPVVDRFSPHWQCMLEWTVDSGS
jgi:hypothetical protein